MITRSIRAVEQRKYEAMWGQPAYRLVSPGETLVDRFLELAGDARGRLIDIGCGTGRAGAALAALGFEVTLLDGTAAGLEVHDLPFVEACLWDDWPSVCAAQDVGYCCDVLEHLPIEFTGLVIANTLRACRRVCLHISNEPDVCGRLIGEPLHLTVRPYVWWRDRLAELGTLLDARDLLGTSLFYVARRES